MALYFCAIAFIACLVAGRRSLLSGLVVLLAIGYVYGIIRANLPDTFSHFIFDAGVVGLYCAQLFRSLTAIELSRAQGLKVWLEFLTAWPILLFMIPIQDYLVQLVGLRGSIFLLPFILIGARLDDHERYRLAICLSAFNLIALAVAVVEFSWGIEQFFPKNEVTKLIYMSKDLVGHTAYRIPSFFSGAHAYAVTMVVGLPFLGGALLKTAKRDFNRIILIAGIVASLLGVFLTGTRLHFVSAALVVLVAVFSVRSRLTYFAGWLLLLGGIAWVVSGDQRLQRFTELGDTQMVSERIVGSVNMNLLELAASHPFGNGLGGGGTSLPYFLSDRLQNPLGMENEYARIMLEQGLIGLGLWIGFVLWVLTRRSSGASDDPWAIGRRLAWVTCASYFAAGLIGIGIYTSIPATCLFFLNIGWVAARQESNVPELIRTSYRELSNYPVPESV